MYNAPSPKHYNSRSAHTIPKHHLARWSEPLLFKMSPNKLLYQRLRNFSSFSLLSLFYFICSFRSFNVHFFLNFSPHSFFTFQSPIYFLLSILSHFLTHEPFFPILSLLFSFPFLIRIPFFFLLCTVITRRLKASQKTHFAWGGAVRTLFASAVDISCGVFWNIT